MARIRTVKPEFWEDEKIGKLPIPCRLFFIGCWNFADDFGVIKSNAALLKSQIFPYDENLRVSEIKKWIDALVDARMLIPIIHKEESYYIIRTFRSHQIIDKRYDKSYISKDKYLVNELISRALKNDDVNTTSTPRDNDVFTTTEKEEEKEDKKESPNGDKKEAVASSPAPSNLDFLKFNDWLKRKAPFCSNPKNFSSQITEAEFLKLKEKYTGKQIADVIEQIENRKDLRKRYTNLYRTVLNWAKKEYGY